MLTLYLPLDDVPAIDRGYVARAKDLIKGLKTEHPEAAADAERALAHIEEMTPTGRTLVVLSSVESDTLDAFHLQVRLPAVARFAEAAYLAPLESAFDNYPVVAVAAIGERDARILVSDLCELTESVTFSDDVARRQRQGGWAASRIESDRAEHVREHYRKAARVLHDKHQETAFTRLVLAGAPESTAGLFEELDAGLRVLVAGTPALATYLSDTDLLAAALPTVEAAERREEQSLVEEIHERALAGGDASLGWDETMQMLKEGRVYKLALGENSLRDERGAQVCALAWETDADIEFLHGDAEAAMNDNGGIGALLRY
jgi:peptide subunit release factor 1 (eRF1)